MVTFSPANEIFTEKRNFHLLKMAFHLLLFVIIVFPFVDSTCNRSCGGLRNRVPYPFGFSIGCPILMDCINGREVRIGGFRVRNVTSDNILLDLPANCSRPISSIERLFGKNYAPTWKNGLLLHNCRSVISGCVIPTALMEEGFGRNGCDWKKENVSCFSKGGGDPLMRYENVTGSGCGSLFSSVAVGLAEKGPAFQLEFGMVELEWWVPWSCASRPCSNNATCMTVNSMTNGGPALRCRCKQGFFGDGFQSGDGCMRVSFNSDCTAKHFMTGDCGGNSKVGVLIGGIVAGASLMAILATIWFFTRGRSAYLRTRKSTKRLLAEAAGSCTIPFFPYREIEKATYGFAEMQRLGTGAYGTVYAGKLHDKQVAVKKIRNCDNDGMEQVLNEIKLLSSVSHPNLVHLLGCCIEGGVQILVYEFMPNGTLSQHLQRERGSGLPWTIRLTIAAETANAIAHLHSSINPPIYHRDIKSTNILLDYNFKSKVADFGLSRLGMVESSHISTAPQGTPGYLDPQYHQSFHLSDKSDVYSFGVVLVEMITALKAVDFTREENEVNLAALAVDKIGKGSLDEIIDPFLEPHRDAWTLSSIHKVAELAFQCLAFDRDMRPSMMEVAAELEHIRLSGWAETEENNFVGRSVSSCSLHSNDSQKKSAGGQMLMVPQRSECSILKEEIKGCSPNSVQDPWFSEQSSPSSNSLLESRFERK